MIVNATAATVAADGRAIKHTGTAGGDDAGVTKKVVTEDTDEDTEEEEPEEAESATKAAKSATTFGSTKKVDGKKKVEEGEEDW